MCIYKIAQHRCYYVVQIHNKILYKKCSLYSFYLEWLSLNINFKSSMLFGFIIFKEQLINCCFISFILKYFYIYIYHIYISNGTKVLKNYFFKSKFTIFHHFLYHILLYIYVLCTNLLSQFYGRVLKNLSL